MKKYRLLKDLPTFKAGDEFTIGDDGCLWSSHYSASDGHWKPQVMAYHKNTLAHFPNILEDWFEEIEEPKKYWYLNREGAAYCDVDDGSDFDERHKSIGNYFETEEEAERAVEKLKAWKRLRDRGFKVIEVEVGRYENLCGNGLEIPLRAVMPSEAYANLEVAKDLGLLFGGEE